LFQTPVPTALLFVIANAGSWQAPQLTVRWVGGCISKIAFRRAQPWTVLSGYPLVIKMHLNVVVFTWNNTLIEVLFPSGDNFLRE